MTLCQNITNGFASAKDVENLTISEICDDVLPEKVRFEPMNSVITGASNFQWFALRLSHLKKLLTNLLK